MAGYVSATTLNALSVAQSRMQVQAALQSSSNSAAALVRKQYGSTISALSTIWRQEGMRGLYRGYGTSVLLIPGFWGVYFTTYEGLKPIFTQSFSNWAAEMSKNTLPGAVSPTAATPLPPQAATYGSTKPSAMQGAASRRASAADTSATCLPALPHEAVPSVPVHPSSTPALAAAAVAAATAGAIGDCVTYPLWTVRVRLHTQAMHAAAGSNRAHFRNTYHALRSIVKSEGVSSLYRGLPASLMGVSHVAVQFPLYELLKGGFPGSGATPPDGQPPSTVRVAAAAVASKTAATLATYPFETIRNVMQDDAVEAGTGVGQRSTRRFAGVAAAARFLLRDGPRGLYAGIGANIARSVPSTIITMVVYELVCRG